MDAAIISIIMSSVTAIAAVVAPVVSSVITAKSTEKIKHFELHSPQVYCAVKQLAEAYSKFHREKDYIGANDFRISELDAQVSEIYKNFALASYEVMSLIPDNSIHQEIISLMTELKDVCCATAENDEKFQELIIGIAPELSAGRSKKRKRISSKSKRSNRT